MKIAVTFENGNIYQHFGHTERFKIYVTEDNDIKSSEVVDTNGSGHGALARFLKDRSVEVLICGGIGAGAKAALAGEGIALFGGVSGDADNAVRAYLSGRLSYDPDIECAHHSQARHEHNCGGHN